MQRKISEKTLLNWTETLRPLTFDRYETLLQQNETPRIFTLNNPMMPVAPNAHKHGTQTIDSTER